MRRVRLTGPARQDIANILRRSGDEFGEPARTRYRRLIDRALNDLARDPARVGTRSIDDIRAEYFIYPLRTSNSVAGTVSVARPRHLIAFYIDTNGDVIVARLFHERQLLAQHLNSSDAS